MRRYFFKNRNKIILEASSDADSSELIWFCGSDFITRTKPNEVYEWNCPLGKHEITVVDSKGNNVNYEVVDTDMISFEYLESLLKQFVIWWFERLLAYVEIK